MQPIPIHPTLWTYISMEFIVGLWKVGNKLVIMVVVDWLSKYSHFVLSNNHSHLQLLLKFYWTNFLNSITCPLPLYLIMIPLSLMNSRKKYLSYREHSWKWAHLIIHKSMARLKQSTNLLKSICDVLPLKNNTNGLIGYLW